MAQESSKSSGLSPEVKQALIIGGVIIALLFAVWSGSKSLRSPEMVVVGTLNESGKPEEGKSIQP